MLFASLSAVMAIAQANLVLGDRMVTKEEYEAALPYINIDRVRLRDSPSVNTERYLLYWQKGLFLIFTLLMALELTA